MYLGPLLLFCRHKARTVPAIAAVSPGSSLSALPVTAQVSLSTTLQQSRICACTTDLAASLVDLTLGTFHHLSVVSRALFHLVVCAGSAFSAPCLEVLPSQQGTPGLSSGHLGTGLWAEAGDLLHRQPHI